MAEKILIVDDDEFFQLLMQQILEQLDYVVEVAKDGLEAWDKIVGDPQRFDLMLLDKKMPQMDGLALLKRIKADERLKDMPVILLTGDGRQEDIVEGLAEGAYYYLTKPSTESVLKCVIKNALDESRQIRELRSRLGHQTNCLNHLMRAEFSFRSLQEAKDLALLLAEVSTDPRRTINGYSEMLINAVEHGNLGITYAEKGQLLKEGRWAAEVETRLQRQPYADRQVRVTVEKTASACRVTVTDQGGGFDWQEYLSFNPERMFDLHGRGIAISNALCFDGLEYLGNGNTVVITVNRAAR